MVTWKHDNGSSTLDGVPASMFYYDQLSDPTFVDTDAQKQELMDNPGMVLVSEGLANDVTTFINRSRRNAGCGVSDNVKVRIDCGETLGWAIVWSLDKVMRNTKTVHIDFNVDDDVRHSDDMWDDYDAGSKDVPFPVSISVVAL